VGDGLGQGGQVGGGIQVGQLAVPVLQQLRQFLRRVFEAPGQLQPQAQALIQGGQALGVQVGPL